MSRSPGRALALAAGAILIVTGCSSGSSPSTAASAAPSSATITVPDAIKTAGRLVWCVDVSYPPEEFYAADGTTAQGSDIDIAKEIGKRFGVTTEIDNTGFDGIIPALNANKCDLIISGMNSTEERKK
jgi:polar amino acid transport system substrate-binding protein